MSSSCRHHCINSALRQPHGGLPSNVDSAHLNPIHGKCQAEADAGEMGPRPLRSAVPGGRSPQLARECRRGTPAKKHRKCGGMKPGVQHSGTPGKSALASSPGGPGGATEAGERMSRRSRRAPPRFRHPLPGVRPFVHAGIPEFRFAALRALFRRTSGAN
jgi:hypothetical protein